MPRSYDVKVVALTVDAPVKWIDNLLSHHAIPGVERARQGVERRINDDGLLAIESVRLLVAEFGLPVGKAAALIRAAFHERVGSSQLRIVTASGIAIEIPSDDIARRLRERVVDAIEAVPRVRRGRPPARSPG